MPFGLFMVHIINNLLRCICELTYAYFLSSTPIILTIITSPSLFSPRNSPVRYPNLLYSGPPIPLDYSDSSDHSPDKVVKSR